ncbi:MAG: hypothetical protein MUF57_09695, partial [Gammaproteobacteria bacterium]|nr:hypothetical protein [Gammaproteobacteria bacterium]
AERPYRLMLVQEGSARRLYVDRNRNGDFTDDGEALRSEGSGRFAAGLKLPLAEVTGGRLEGIYDLWVYLDDRRDDQLHVYSRTQLAGEVSVEGRRIPAVLADNVLLDGDYTNDGIAPTRTTGSHSTSTATGASTGRSSGWGRARRSSWAGGPTASASAGEAADRQPQPGPGSCRLARRARTASASSRSSGTLGQPMQASVML